MSPKVDSGLVLIRRALEEHIATEKAPKILFEALSELPADEDLPQTSDGLARFLAGPLAKVLFARLGPETGAAILGDLMTALAAAHIDESADDDDLEIDVEVGEVLDSSEAFELSADRRRTSKVSTAALRGETTRLMIVSRTTRLARWIRAAFGNERLTVSVSTRLDQCTNRLHSFEPTIIIIDGQDAADIGVDDIAILLASAPESTLAILWASNHADSIATRASSEKNGATIAAIPRNAGFEPMLDYIRARVS